MAWSRLPFSENFDYITRRQLRHSKAEVEANPELETQLQRGGWTIFHEADGSITATLEQFKDQAVKMAICQGLRPAVATKANIPPALHELMRDCWAADPNKRPPMVRISKRLENILDSLIQEEAAAIIPRSNSSGAVGVGGAGAPGGLFRSISAPLTSHTNRSSTQTTNITGAGVIVSPEVVKAALAAVTASTSSTPVPPLSTSTASAADRPKQSVFAGIADRRPSEVIAQLAQLSKSTPSPSPTPSSTDNSPRVAESPIGNASTNPAPVATSPITSPRSGTFVPYFPLTTSPSSSSPSPSPSPAPPLAASAESVSTSTTSFWSSVRAETQKQRVSLERQQMQVLEMVQGLTRVSSRQLNITSSLTTTTDRSITADGISTVLSSQTIHVPIAKYAAPPPSPSPSATKPTPTPFSSFFASSSTSPFSTATSSQTQQISYSSLPTSPPAWVRPTLLNSSPPGWIRTGKSVSPADTPPNHCSMSFTDFVAPKVEAAKRSQLSDSAVLSEMEWQLQALEDFSEFDETKTGHLPFEAFKLLLRSLCKRLNYPVPSKHELLTAFAEIDAENTYVTDLPHLPVFL